MESENIVNSKQLGQFSRSYRPLVPYTGAELTITELVGTQETAESLSVSNLKKRSLNDLQTIAKGLKIPISSTKSDLIQRISIYFGISDE